MEVFGVVCGERGCGLVVSFFWPVQVQVYHWQLPPVRKEPAFISGLAAVPRSHNTGQWSWVGTDVPEGGKDCTTIPLVRLVSFAGQCRVAEGNSYNLQHIVGCVEDGSDSMTRLTEARCPWKLLHYSRVLEQKHPASVVQLSSQLIHKIFKEGLPRHTILYKIGLWHLSGLAM